MIDPTTIDELFKLSLPNGQVVKLRPSRYCDVISLLKENVGKEELGVETMKRNLMLMLSSVVQQVDEISDQTMISEWLAQCPTTWITRIAERIEKISEWGPALKWRGKCKDCGNDLEVELPINPVTFFTE
jgi:hypothetical protein